MSKIRDHQSTQPAIRFKGFTDAWEQRKVSELADRYDNLRVPITASERVAGETPYYGANGIQDYVERFTHNGEFVLVAEDGANDLQNYPVQYVDGKVWVNNHAHVLQAKEERVDNKFLTNALKHTNIEPYLVGGGRAKLNADVMMKINFKVPTLPEQVQIGKFFDNLDHLITLHQRKLAKLKELKQGYLQKLFPRNGSKFPQLRFAGFADAWEKRKLTELSKNKIGGGTPSTKVLDFWNGKLPWLQSSDINESNNYSVKPQKFISLQALKHSAAKRVPANSIAVVTRVGVGKLALIEYDYSTSQDFLSFSSLNWSALFSVNLLTLIMTQMSRESQGTSIKGVTKSELLAKKVRIPISLKEQEKLGILMKSINDLIAATQRKGEVLKNLKKALLQKMFV
ncbi:restriction endonuclease subunit S [Lacticaseibacillus rhamnosus]|uniref:restriction endonuclease subunit S n=1 Tax=Lacticaseibacillus rhamnosus TaxID=47715 RepID=UPI00066908A9|nr:restriction endonuclease subunit S [Lacticaseibacillus rhamnosus]